MTNVSFGKSFYHSGPANTTFNRLFIGILRDLPQMSPDLCAILVSAMLDVNSFGEYFASVSGPTLVPYCAVCAHKASPSC